MQKDFNVKQAKRLKQELLDRVYVQACNIQNHLLGHPYADYNDHVAVRLQLVFETLMDIIEQPDLVEEYTEDMDIDTDNTSSTQFPIYQSPTFS